MVFDVSVTLVPYPVLLYRITRNNLFSHHRNAFYFGHFCNTLPDLSPIEHAWDRLEFRLSTSNEQLYLVFFAFKYFFTFTFVFLTVKLAISFANTFSTGRYK
jgi:hypothetical protein